jgi:hypothetical protein
MKINQNDLIVSIVAVVLGLGFSAAFFFMQRKPITVAPPQSVVTSAPALPTGNVVMANALPGAGGGGAVGGGFGGGMGAGMSGPPAGMPGRGMGAPSGGAPPPGAGGAGAGGVAGAL